MTCCLFGASHHQNQCWFIFHWSHGNKFQCNSNQNKIISIRRNGFENGIWKLVAILCQPQCVQSGKKIYKKAHLWEAMVHSTRLFAGGPGSAPHIVSAPRGRNHLLGSKGPLNKLSFSSAVRCFDAVIVSVACTPSVPAVLILNVHSPLLPQFRRRLGISANISCTRDNVNLLNPKKNPLPITWWLFNRWNVFEFCTENGKTPKRFDDLNRCYGRTRFREIWV